MTLNTKDQPMTYSTGHPDDRIPYLGSGADGCRLSAQQDRAAAADCDSPGDAPMLTDLLDSAVRWEAQAARLDAAAAGAVGPLACMVADVYATNELNGWFDADRTWGDTIALLHSEVSEALEAFRDYKLEDATGPGEALWEEDHMGNNTIPAGHKPAKPEGVGSELADVLIRALDTCYRQNINPDRAKATAPASGFSGAGLGESFGDACTYLHARITWLAIAAGTAFSVEQQMGQLLLALDRVADKFGVDLRMEYERKLAFNRTRGYRHGGRSL